MSVIDDYLANVVEPQKVALEHVREIVKQTAPTATEVITYGMPGFKYKGKYLIAFASFKDHLSVFPGAGAIEATKDQLINYKMSKGTIQFTVDKPLPDKIIAKIITIRMSQIDTANPKIGN